MVENICSLEAFDKLQKNVSESRFLLPTIKVYKPLAQWLSTRGDAEAPSQWGKNLDNGKTDAGASNEGGGEMNGYGGHDIHEGASQPYAQLPLLTDVNVTKLTEENHKQVEQSMANVSRNMNQIKEKTSEWNSCEYPWTNIISAVNYDVFGHAEFRELQEEVINACLSGRDTFVMMPTGGGKSLCFQLTAYVDQKLTVVVMPLISLMTDQYEQMLTLGIPSAYLAGDQSLTDQNHVYESMGNGDIVLLFVTPEKLKASAKLINKIDQLHKHGRLSKFAIDEAHCVSTWGNDFRKDYLDLKCLRIRYPEIPIMALTATATPDVIRDVQLNLRMKNCVTFSRSFDRPNLKFVVQAKKKSTYLADVVKIISRCQRDWSGIVYSLSKRDCESVSDALCAAGIRAAPYHAGLSAGDRKNNQMSWMNDDIQCICATIAFGMGINKKDVRYVIHTSMPKNIENYYQESGRAGRDGVNATCILLYDYGDKSRLLNLMGLDNGVSSKKQKDLNFMVAYCEYLYTCRRKLILNHFGESHDGICPPNTFQCDACENRRGREVKILNASKEAVLVMKAVRSLCGSGTGSNGYKKKGRHTGLTLSALVTFLMGSSVAKIADLKFKKGYGQLKTLGWNINKVGLLLKLMLVKELLSEVGVSFNQGPMNSVVSYICETVNYMDRDLDNIPLPEVLIELPFSKSTDEAVRQNEYVPAQLDTNDWINTGTKRPTAPYLSEDERATLFHQEPQGLSETERATLLNRLTSTRRSISKEKSITNVTVIASYQAMQVMCVSVPITKEALRSVEGAGFNTVAKVNQYGEGFVNCIEDYLLEIGKLHLGMSAGVTKTKAKAKKTPKKNPTSKFNQSGLNLDDFVNRSDFKPKKGQKKLLHALDAPQQKLYPHPKRSNDEGTMDLFSALENIDF